MHNIYFYLLGIIQYKKMLSNAQHVYKYTRAQMSVGRVFFIFLG